MIASMKIADTHSLAMCICDSPDGNNWKIGANSAELFAQNVDINLRAVGCGIGFKIPNVVKKGLFVYISFYGL